MSTSSGSSASATRARLAEALHPVLADSGFDLEDVTVSKAGSRSLVRVVVDRDGGLDLDGVADASRAVGHYLDQHIDPVRLAVLPPNIRASETNDKGPAAGVDLAIY